MRQVIKSAAESGDGVSIEREQPSTAFRPMPHITTWDGLLVASGRDELIGNFDHYTKPDLSYANKEIRPVKAVTETDAVGGITQLEDMTFTPFEVNKEVVSIQDHNRFNPGPFQEGSAIFPGHGVIAEDQIRGSFRDSLTGEGRPMNVWKKGGATSFEDRLALDFDSNDAQFGVKENIDWTAANRGLGSSYMTAKLGTTAGPGGSTFMTETFEPAAGMDSFGESLNPVLDFGANSGPGGSTLMTGNIGCKTMLHMDNITGSAGPGGDDI